MIRSKTPSIILPKSQLLHPQGRNHAIQTTINMQVTHSSSDHLHLLWRANPKANYPPPDTAVIFRCSSTCQQTSQNTCEKPATASEAVLRCHRSCSNNHCVKAHNGPTATTDTTMPRLQILVSMTRCAPETTANRRSIPSLRTSMSIAQCNICVNAVFRVSYNSQTGQTRQSSESF